MCKPSSQKHPLFSGLNSRTAFQCIQPKFDLVVPVCREGEDRPDRAMPPRSSCQLTHLANTQHSNTTLIKIAMLIWSTWILCSFCFLCSSLPCRQECEARPGRNSPTCPTSASSWLPLAWWPPMWCWPLSASWPDLSLSFPQPFHSLMLLQKFLGLFSSSHKLRTEPEVSREKGTERPRPGTPLTPLHCGFPAGVIFLTITADAHAGPLSPRPESLPKTESHHPPTTLHWAQSLPGLGLLYDQLKCMLFVWSLAAAYRSSSIIISSCPDVPSDDVWWAPIYKRRIGSRQTAFFSASIQMPPPKIDRCFESILLLHLNVIRKYASIVLW